MCFLLGSSQSGKAETSSCFRFQARKVENYQLKAAAKVLLSLSFKCFFDMFKLNYIRQDGSFMDKTGNTVSTS